MHNQRGMSLLPIVFLGIAVVLVLAYGRAFFQMD